MILLVIGGTNSKLSTSNNVVVNKLSLNKEANVISDTHSVVSIKPIPDPPQLPARQRDVVAREIARVSPSYSANRSDSQTRGMEICRQTWSEEECEALNEIITAESGWQVGIWNGEGCAGLGQACPASKMGSAYGSLEGELGWTMDYIRVRFGSPSEAKKFHIAHGWY